MKEKRSMKNLPMEERPYEKCLSGGVRTLSDAELLAAILGNGTIGKTALELAMELLYENTSEPGFLHILQLGLEDLQRIQGIGKAKAIRLLCVAEFARRLAKQSAKDRLDFSNPKSVADYYMEDLRHLKQEQLILVMLNGKNKLLGDKTLFVGTVNQSLVNPREVYLEALKREAVFIILLHNHPSGDITPSNADVVMTRKMKEAGELIGIRLLDHIIIGNQEYSSFCNQGLL